MPLDFEPALLNSASPWATTREDLEALLDSPHTGAVTVRTSLLLGWNHDDNVHQYAFFESKSGEVQSQNSINADSSLNTLGYSPIDLRQYLDIITSIVSERQFKDVKPIIVSVTGTAEEISECYALIAERASVLEHRLLMEINLSCPNIAHKPPPAYSAAALKEYLDAISGAIEGNTHGTIEVGIKAPPFTYFDQFNAVIDTLRATTRDKQQCPISYIASTNTLGNCLVTAESSTEQPALASASGEGLGGLGGAAIHTLSLGNVAKFRRMLDQHPELKHIEIIGVGGVLNNIAYTRMRNAGAVAVGVATGLGLKGVDVFKDILKT